MVGIGKLWRTPKTEKVETDEGAAAQRKETKPVFGYISRPAYKVRKFAEKARINGRFADKNARPEWVPDLQAILGSDFTLVCQPGEAIPDATDDDLTPDPPDAPAPLLPPFPASPDGSDRGVGRSPTEAQGTAVNGTGAVVAPPTVAEEADDRGPRKPLGRSEGYAPHTWAGYAPHQGLQGLQAGYAPHTRSGGCTCLPSPGYAVPSLCIPPTGLLP
jgi:hypothetical protein